MIRERIIQLPKIIDERGNLSFIEAREHIPFNIARSYWLYDVPGGTQRGSHAFVQQHELIIALSGSFDVVLDNGHEKRTYTLNRSYKGLYVPNMIWKTLENFSTNSLCLVITSEAFSEKDYIRDYDVFQKQLAIETSLQPQKPMWEPPKNSTTPNYNTVFDCTLIEFPVVKNRAGNITPIHGSENIPFDIERIFYIYDIPTGVSRGEHAHKHCHEVLVAASGSFDVELDDGSNKRIVTLSRPMCGLHIPPGVWATEKAYSAGAICIALASEEYDTEDYIYTYEDFLTYRRNENRTIYT